MHIPGRVLLTLAMPATLAVASSTAAADPILKLRCAPPSHNLVTCHLSGANFRPRERVSVTYRVTYTALPKRHGRFQQSVFQRSATTTRSGTFSRPPLRFKVVPFHGSFSMTVHAVGATRDHASITTIGTED